VKKAKLVEVRGKGRTQRTVFVGPDGRLALADYLELERPATPITSASGRFLAYSGPTPRTASTTAREAGMSLGICYSVQRNIG
jgi:site-specific recombinase XerD